MSSTPRLYARFTRRFWALAVDSAIYGLSLFLLVLLVESVRGTPGGTRGVFLLFLGFLLLYEPVLVWRRGATLGHMAANIRVVDLRSGGNPSFLRAFGRFWLKTLVGLLAFVFMGTTRRHQALHDLAAGTTVEINDPSKARPEHFVEERDDIQAAGLPSKLRRVFVILVYAAVVFILMIVALFATQSAECVERTSACTVKEQLLGSVITLLFLGSLAASIILGWTGRLPGARRADRIAGTTTADAG